ncbi:MAG: hypothetical protein NTX00_04380 [Candidatus Parcubacteria bacterium]|nr:hypothetical protein [Candidatus Parcubacteria bacterium]
MKEVKRVIKLVIVAGLLVFGQQVLAAMTSDNYKVWLDTLSSGGGLVNSTNYKIDSNFTNQTGGAAQSQNFSEKVSFSPIEAEPTVGFNVESAALNFGELSPNSTAYSSHTISAYTNSSSGYTIKVYGTPLNNSYHTITAIGTTANDSVAGTEQFGLNLVSNSVPVIGADPAGGIGQAAANYNTANKFAYNDGDIIAQSASFSYQTDFTVSVIVNIAPETTAGSYGATLTYEFIPIF